MDNSVEIGTEVQQNKQAEIYCQYRPTKWGRYGLIIASLQWSVKSDKLAAELARGFRWQEFGKAASNNVLGKLKSGTGDWKLVNKNLHRLDPKMTWSSSTHRRKKARKSGRASNPILFLPSLLTPLSSPQSLPQYPALLSLSLHPFP